jgi:TonB family protein
MFTGTPFGAAQAACLTKHNDQGACGFRLLTSPKIEVPSSLNLNKLNRMPVLKFELKEDGDVSKADVVKSSRSPEIDELILKRVKEWKFSAAPACGVRLVRMKIIIDLR